MSDPVLQHLDRLVLEFYGLRGDILDMKHVFVEYINTTHEITTNSLKTAHEDTTTRLERLEKAVADLTAFMRCKSC